MTDELDLDALEARAKGATPGPWTADCCSAANMVYDRSDSIGVDATREDAEFIAAANPATVLALIERVRAAEGRIECDGKCDYFNGPDEECSAHGRTPRDLWDAISGLMADRDTARARIAKAEALAAEVQEANHAEGRTHHESCWKYHAGCFATAVIHLTEGDEG